MPENIRAYIVVFALNAFAFLILSRWNPLPENSKQTRRWAGYWIMVTSAAFLTYNYWLFVLLVTGVLLIALPRNYGDRLSTYFLLLPALPILANEVPGFGGVRFFFVLSYPRLLVLFVLLPILFSTFQKNSSEKRNSYFPSDKYLFAFVGLSILLTFRDDNVTSAFRSSFYIILDMLVPYYVISRNARSLDEFKSIFQAIFTSAFVLALIAWFESAKGWLVYKGLNNTLGIPGSRFSGYGNREGFLRVGTTMTTIPFGYFLTIGIGALSFFRTYFSGTRFILLGGAIFVALLATVSRGPWVGFAVFIVVFAFYSQRRKKALLLLAMGFIFGIPLLTVLPGGEKFLSLLPFIGEGSHSAETVSYRQQLFLNSIEVIKMNPWFGSNSYLQSSEMEAMRQGQGIIDIVNTYLRVGLSKGLVGLWLFVGLFSSLLLGIRKAMLQSHPLGEEYTRLGQSLLAILVAVLVIIGTVSSVDYIPVYYWAIAGLGAGYVNMIKIMLRIKATENSQ